MSHKYPVSTLTLPKTHSLVCPFPSPFPITKSTLSVFPLKSKIMGKFLRKAKITGDVAVMEPSSLGVLTRARTLALQSSSDSCYLQLRSRRLHKPFSNPQEQTQSVSVGSVSITRVTEDVNDEISFGENNTLDFQHRDRSTRESTPCSVVREVDTMINPGSATRRTEINTTRNFILRNIPSAHEIEEFFTFAEQQQQGLFMDKYNFDVANDLPLSGRYEWIRVNH